MKDIFLSINNRKEIIKIPVLPKDYDIQSPQNNEKYNTVKYGDINLLGNKGLKTITWSSFFPARKYRFNRDDSMKAYEYVEKIEEWRDKKLPIRLIIINTPINLAVTIDDFTYKEQDGTGDVYYTIKFSEFKFIEV